MLGSNSARPATGKTLQVAAEIHQGIHPCFDFWKILKKYNLVGGWPTPLKNDGVKVSWDDEIPNWMESHKKMFQTSNSERVFQ